jgi:hypothetical protein
MLDELPEADRKTGEMAQFIKGKPTKVVSLCIRTVA